MTYEEFCKVPIGAVIIDDNGCDYVMGESLLWPSNPSDPWSIIRHHKFSFEGFRNATEEETKAFFDALQANGYKWNSNTGHVEELPKKFDKILDEAAEEIVKGFLTYKRAECQDEFTVEELIGLVKAGAKWMAEQGVTTEKTVGRTPLNGPNSVTELK